MFAWINRLDRYIPIRYASWALCIVGFALALAGWILRDWPIWPAIVFAFLVLTGLHDVTQTRQAILRNYPMLGHLRFLLEDIRPEIRQYFLESDTDEMPFSREQRSIVYQRAKNDARQAAVRHASSTCTQADYEWINHSIAPAHIADARLPHHDRRPAVREAVLGQRVQHLGDELRRAVAERDPRAERGRASAGGFYHDTGEGSISRYHREHGGDLVWEIGSGYFGCRNARRHASTRSASPRNAPRSAGEDDRDQAVAGRQAGPRRRAAGREGDARDRRRARRADRRRLHLAGRATRRSRRRSGCSSSSRGCASCRAASRPASSSRSAIRGSGSASPRRCSRPASCRTSSSSTAARAAPARRRSSSPTTSARRCSEGLLLVHNTLVGLDLREQDPHRRSRQGRHRVRHRAHAARSAPTGATPRAASCSRSAASRRRPATPARARPASRRRTRSGMQALVVPDKADARLPLPPEHAEGAEGADAGGGPRPPVEHRRRAHHPAHLRARRQAARQPAAVRADRRAARRRA